MVRKSSYLRLLRSNGSRFIFITRPPKPFMNHDLSVPRAPKASYCDTGRGSLLLSFTAMSSSKNAAAKHRNVLL